jgi:hypothetical protein
MIERIRYRLLMRQLRKEIAAVANGGRDKCAEKMKSAAVTACKAFASIV